MRKKRCRKVRSTIGTLLTAVMCLGITAPAAVEAADAISAQSTEITSVDFSQMKDLNTLNGWTLTPGSGTTTLVKDGELGENVLKMQRTSGGDSMILEYDHLGIREEQYRYVTVETEIRLGTEDHANQFSIPYMADSSNTYAYTLLTEGDWTEYKSHVSGSANKFEAGTVRKGEWQNIRMDIDLKTDTFRVTVDGACVLAGANARAKTDNLQRIRYYADSWNTGTMYLKSVRVTAEAERTECAVFYVRTDGNDYADGMSETSAWASIDRVNEEHFIPGDKILFEKGGVWENQTLHPQGSGSADNYIMLGSYGTGDMPRIDVNGQMEDGLFLCNQQYWDISGLNISNTAEGFTMVAGENTPDGNVMDRAGEQGGKLGDYRGIHIAGRDVASLKGFRIHDVKVHDVTGEVAWIGNTGLSDAGIVNNAGLDGSKRTGGILIECLKPSGSQATQFSDIVIEDSQFINNSFCGITVKQWNGSGSQYGTSPGWANRGNRGGAPDYADSKWKPHSNIRIQNNYINQGASAYACNGIYLTSSRDSLIQNNVLEHIGTCGIELYFTDNVAVQYNEISDVVKKGGGADDNAIDPDWMVTNALIQYNYVHNCGEGFLLCGVAFNSGIIRYNLIQDVSRSYVHYSMGSGYFQIYNNVFYRSADGSGSANFDPWGSGSSVSYFNNIFYDGKKEGFHFSTSGNYSYNNNAYYGTAATSKDADAILLEESPFAGEAPSPDRKGSFNTGVLLEANGLRLKEGSVLAKAGTIRDANGTVMGEGLLTKGSRMNFTSLREANEKYFDRCIRFEGRDYPAFEKTGAEATLDTAKTQTPVDTAQPAVGLFEEVTVPAAEVLADFTFDDEDSGFTSAYAKAAGTHGLEEHDGYGKALYLDGTDDFLRVTAPGGGSLLTGVQEMTISFQAKPDAADKNWLFYAAPDESEQNYKTETYMGILDKNGSIQAERYNNSGTRPATAKTDVTPDEWYYLTVVQTKTETIIYVNGEEKVRQSSDYSLTDILEANSILFIGKANWDSGEYYKGLIDNYRIYSRALDEAEVKALAEQYQEKTPDPDPTPDPEPEPELPYVDVNRETGGWYYDAVYDNYLAGTMTGKDPTHFAPAETLVRAQFAAVLYKMNKSPAVEYKEIFSDVTDEQWFTDCVLWAAENKIVTGYTDTNTFKPVKEVSRAELATMLYRYVSDYKGYDVAADGDYSAFPDADQVQEFAEKPVKWAVANGIITGKMSGGQLILDPQGNANRAECAIMIQRFMKLYVQ